MGLETLPKDIIEDIELAKSIILAAGAQEIYIFGSLASGEYDADSDIDIAITGLEKKKFFQVYGELLSRLKRSVDIVGLDYHTDFSSQIRKEKNFVRVA